MSVSLTSNFFSNSRGLTLLDGGGITWSINKNTNQITATAGSAGTATTATNLAAGAAGSLPYQSAAATTAMLAVAANGSLLTVTAGLPAWEAVPTWNQNTTGNAATATTAAACSGNSATATTAAACSGNAATATTAGNVTGLVVGTNGGTGVNNGARTLTYAGNVTFSGAFTFTGTLTATTGVTFPTTGTLATTAQLPVGANPSATAGLAAVNGVATTFMTSDSAPPLSQAITPTWTKLHTFSGTVASSIAGCVLLSTTNPLIAWQDPSQGSNAKVFDMVATAGTLNIRTATDVGAGNKVIWSAARSGAAVTSVQYGNSTDNPTHTFFGAVGVNGNAPPAQSTGWGTPTGGSVQNNYAAGVGATLLSTSDAVAQIITVLKQVGIFGA